MATLQSNEEHIKRLKTFAASDANHDFGAVFTSVYPIHNKDLGTPAPPLTVPYVSDPWQLLSDFMISPLNVKSIPLNTPQNITSKTGHDYVLCSFDAKDLDNSMPFLYNEQKEANIVIDALASSWWSAIRDQRGDPLGTLNVLTNREMINDPAGKTNPADKIYKTNNTPLGDRRVFLKSYQDTAPYTITYPEWSSPRTDYHNDFFSRYYLSLNSVQYTLKGYNTQIFFRNQSAADIIPPIPIANTGPDQNSVNVISKKITTLSSKLTAGNRHLFGIYLQQKRSGDSLQVLSTLDNKRPYIQRTRAKTTGLPLSNLETTYTYLVTNDIWNASYAILNGANIILLTNDGDRAYIFRKGIPRDPIEKFLEDGATTIAKHNMDVAAHTVLFNQAIFPFEYDFVEKINQMKEQPQETIELMNEKWRDILHDALVIGFFYNIYKPEGEVKTFDEITANPSLIPEVLEIIRTQKSKQFINEEDVKRKYEAILQNETLGKLKFLLFFKERSTRGDRGFEAAQAVFAALIIFLRLDLEIIPKFYELVEENKDKSQEFTKLYETFSDVLEDYRTNRENIKPKQQRTENGSLSLQTRTDFQDIQENILNKYRLDLINYAILRTEYLLVSEGNNLRGGGSTAIDSLNGNILLQNLLNKDFIPIALSILKGNLTPFKSDVQKDLFIYYVLLGTGKFIAHIPPNYESADNLSKWAPVFIEMLKPLVNETDSNIQVLLLKTYLGIWFESSIGIFSLPEEPWANNASEAGQQLLLYIFGNNIFDILDAETIDSLEGVKFTPVVSSWSESYTNSYNAIMEMVDTYARKEVPTGSSIITALSPKSLSEPAKPATIGIKTNTVPLLEQTLLKNVSKNVSAFSSFSADPIPTSASSSTEVEVKDPSPQKGGRRTRKTKRS